LKPLETSNDKQSILNIAGIDLQPFDTEIRATEQRARAFFSRFTVLSTLFDRRLQTASNHCRGGDRLF
jgi:hypothetical protein